MTDPLFTAFTAYLFFFFTALVIAHTLKVKD